MNKIIIVSIQELFILLRSVINIYLIANYFFDPFEKFTNFLSLVLIFVLQPADIIILLRKNLQPQNFDEREAEKLDEINLGWYVEELWKYFFEDSDVLIFLIF